MAERVGRRGLLSLIQLVTFLLITGHPHNASGKQTWTVGDSFGWNRSPPFSYDQWVAGKIVDVGDELLFSFTAGQHNVLEVTESNLASCITSNPISSSVSDPTIIQLKSAGFHGFISGLPGDCATGMHLSVQVASGSGGSPTSSPLSAPPGAGVPSPAGSSTPASSPANSGTPPGSSPSSDPSAIPPGLPPARGPPVGTVPSIGPGPTAASPAGTPRSGSPGSSSPIGSPPAGYAPGAAPNIPGTSPLSNAPQSLQAPMSIVPGSPLVSASSPGPSATGPEAAPPTTMGSSPSPTPMSGKSPVGFPPGANASAATHRHHHSRPVIMTLAALVFSLYLHVPIH